MQMQSKHYTTNHHISNIPLFRLLISLFHTLVPFIILCKYFLLAFGSVLFSSNGANAIYYIEQISPAVSHINAFFPIWFAVDFFHLCWTFQSMNRSTQRNESLHFPTIAQINRFRLFCSKLFRLQFARDMFVHNCAFFVLHWLDSRLKRIFHLKFNSTFEQEETLSRWIASALFSLNTFN